MNIRLSLGIVLTTLMIGSSFAQADSYCLALRGNGELAPAHWGALAQVVERKGLPIAMAGGSSASINMFLLESIAMNPLVKNAPDASSKKQNASLLLKSLQSYLEVVASHPEWQEMAGVAQYLKQAAGGSTSDFRAWLQAMVEKQPQELLALVTKHGTQIQKSFDLAAKLGIVNPVAIAPVQQALKDAQTATNETEKEAAMKRVRFFAGELHQSVSLLGKFNAETDQNIFFRPGVVNFKKLSESFGRIGNFYAAREMTSVQTKALQEFIAVCAKSSAGQTWDAFRGTHPDCDLRIKQLIVDYQKSGLPNASNGRQLDQIGAEILALPSTSVLKDQGYLAAQQAMATYPMSLDPAFGRNFRVDEKDVAFGYWGTSASLSKIERNFAVPAFQNDEKSRRFMALGPASWMDAISTSPAEPGLAPLQEISTPQGPAYSAGGWSDLHPGAVLKAVGCHDIVYVTRAGGESLFGQGIAKRLLGFNDVPWDRLSTDASRKQANVIRNNSGDPSDMTSMWSRLYNLANPESSFNTSLKLFNNVVCTDWNRFDIQKSNAVSEMIQDAYHAPWTNIDITAKNNAVDATLGFRPYAGCVPF